MREPILKRDFTDATHCGRCSGNRRTPLTRGIAYFFRAEGERRYAGPDCAKHQSSNWRRFPDFTRGFARVAAEVDDDFRVIDARDNAGGEHRAEVEYRTAIEYVGLRARLGLFEQFPVLGELLRFHERIEDGQELTAPDVARVLQIARNYCAVNRRATLACMQQCYALDVALTTLIRRAPDQPYPKQQRAVLRRLGGLSEQAIVGLRPWFDRRDIPFPNTAALQLPNPDVHRVENRE